MDVRLHDDELEIDDTLVRRLLGTLSSSYDDLPLRRFESSGSSNALFRLGDDLLVRLPRQPGGTETIEKEHRWLPFVGPRLPVPVPEVLAVGDPGFGYPERWSLVCYLDGEQPTVPAAGEDPRHGLADDLAAVVGSLAAIEVPAEARRDPALAWYRGRPVATMDEDMRSYLAESRALAAAGRLDGYDVDLDAIESAWASVRSMPEAGHVVEPRWFHGDLDAENLLVRGGRLAAVLDFGGLSVGDPTIDLVVAWKLLDREARREFRSAVEIDDVAWRLAAGWALVLGVMGLPYYWDTLRPRCLRSLHAAREAVVDLAEAGASG